MENLNLNDPTLGCGYSNARTLTGDPKLIKQLIDKVLSDDGDACWNEGKKYIQAPGVDGNAHYDHKAFLDIFWQYDQKINDGFVRQWAHEAGLKNPAVWNVIARFLRSQGFDIRNGYIVALLPELRKKREEQLKEIERKTKLDDDGQEAA